MLLVHRTSLCSNLSNPTVIREENLKNKRKPSLMEQIRCRRKSALEGLATLSPGMVSQSSKTGIKDMHGICISGKGNLRHIRIADPLHGNLIPSDDKRFRLPVCKSNN
jgi:hypothetical protein